jgi:hypothetical protein
LYNQRWQEVLIFTLVRCPEHDSVEHLPRHSKKRQRFSTSVFHDSDSDLTPQSVTILDKLGVKALKDLDSLPIDDELRAKIAAEIKKIPKFSTFTRCNV